MDGDGGNRGRKKKNGVKKRGKYKEVRELMGEDRRKQKKGKK